MRHRSSSSDDMPHVLRLLLGILTAVGIVVVGMMCLILYHGLQAVAADAGMSVGMTFTVIVAMCVALTAVLYGLGMVAEQVPGRIRRWRQ